MMGKSIKCDIAIVGGGVVGISTAYWLSELYDCDILLIEKESGIAFHQSSRNTGGVHRPVLEDPRHRVGRYQVKSFHLWRKIAEDHKLPWKTLGRLTVATEQEDVSFIEQSYKWGIANGVPEQELKLLDGNEMKTVEPNVRCIIGLLSATETMTHYGELAGKVFALALRNGVRFARGLEVRQLREAHGKMKVVARDTATHTLFEIECSYLINTAGGAALKLAKMLGLGNDYVDLQLRGDYWVVEGPPISSITRNIYPITSHGIKGIDLSFTGPHLINRYDTMGGWQKQIGPTAAPVFGAYAYRGIAEGPKEFVTKFFGRPYGLKLKTFTKRDFISFAWNQWMMVNSKKNVVGYLNHCIPGLKESMIVGRGVTGVIVETLGREGFLTEPTLIEGPSSVSVLYVGGATAAPAFAADLVTRLQRSGHLDGYHKKPSSMGASSWDFNFATDFKMP
jgi:L-2-hydroxyglutarate oxidase